MASGTKDNILVAKWDIIFVPYFTVFGGFLQ